MRAVELRAEARRGPLVLRPPVPGDVDALTEACQDHEVQRWTTVPLPYRREDAVQFVEGYAAAGWSGGHLPVFAVTDAGTGRYLATVDLRLGQSELEGTASVGFMVAPWARGQGVATAAVTRVCRWGFDTLGLGRVEWWAYVGNEASRRTAVAAGFRMEGTCRSRLVQRAQRRDAWVGGLLPEDLRHNRRGPTGSPSGPDSWR